MGGIGYLSWVIIDKKSSVTLTDIYPGILILIASGVLFWMVRFLGLSGGTDDNPE